MASTLTNTNIRLEFRGTFSSAFGELKPGVNKLLNWGNGLTAGTGDLFYAASRTVASSGSPDTIDLAGSLVMADGNSAVFAKITGIYVEHLGVAVTDDANILTVGAGSNPFITWLAATGDGVKVRNNPGFFASVAGDLAAYAVTGGTGDILQIATAAGTNVPYLIILTGRSS